MLLVTVTVMWQSLLWLVMMWIEHVGVPEVRAAESLMVTWNQNWKLVMLSVCRLLWMESWKYVTLWSSLYLLYWRHCYYCYCGADCCGLIVVLWTLVACHGGDDYFSSLPAVVGFVVAVAS